MSLHRTLTRAPSLALLALVGCGDSGGGATASAGFPGITTANVTLTATAGDSSAPTTTAPTTTSEPPGEASGPAGETTGAAGETAPTPKFDIGDSADPTTAGPGPTSGGCTKVDFLFVVDNSGSMAGEQKNLIASFPGFIDTITQTLDAKDFHVMAVSTDNGKKTGLNSMCTNGKCTCAPAPVCCESACDNGTSCNGFACDDLPIGVCDFEYGTGKQYDATGKPCDLAGGKRYMTHEQPDLAGSFACVANVGTYGSGDEKPMLTVAEALGDPKNAPGGCNDGFLRDDAILVLTFITDEEDDWDGGDGSPGDPQAWYDAVVAAKNGDPKSVVVLGLLGDSNLPNGLCKQGVDPDEDENGAEDAPRLQQFTALFPNGVTGSVCAPDYTPFFQQAVGVIDVVCDNFEPPG